jgi:hypothetical protein
MADFNGSLQRDLITSHQLESFPNVNRAQDINTDNPILEIVEELPLDLDIQVFRRVGAVSLGGFQVQRRGCRIYSQEHQPSTRR